MTAISYDSFSIIRVVPGDNLSFNETSRFELDAEINRLRSALRSSENSRKQLQLEIDLILNSRTYKYGVILRNKSRPIIPLVSKALYFRNKITHVKNSWRYGVRKLVFGLLPLKLIRVSALIKLLLIGFRRNIHKVDKNAIYNHLLGLHNNFQGLAEEDQFKFLSINDSSNLEWINRNISLSILATRTNNVQVSEMPSEVHNLYIDCRALENIALRERGVGEISKNVIRDAKIRFPNCSIILIVNNLNSKIGFSNFGLLSVNELKFEKVRESATVFINLSPMTEESIEISKFLLNPSIYKISIFYDLIPSHFPKRYLSGKEHTLYYSRFLCLDFYHEIWTISKSVEVELKTHFPERKILTRLPQSMLSNGRDSSKKARIIIFVGGGDPRKNNWYAISSILEFCKKEDYFLIILGLYELKDNIDFVFSRFKDHFRVETRVSESKKFELISTSRILVCASLDEGLSLPPIEGVLSGTAVVASDISVHERSLGAGFWLFNPWSITGLSKALDKVSRNLDEVQVAQKISYRECEVGNYFE